MPDLVRVARIGKPHGIRGEVTVEVFTDSPETRFVKGNVFTAKPSQASNPIEESLTLERARWNKRILLLTFVEVYDRNMAEALRDYELFSTLDHPLDDAEGWYASDLIGLTVHKQSADSVELGRVTDLVTGHAQDLLKIEIADGREVLIPFVEEIVPEIDEERGILIITPPPGLLELNQD